MDPPGALPPNRPILFESGYTVMSFQRSHLMFATLRRMEDLDDSWWKCTDTLESQKSHSAVDEHLLKLEINDKSLL